MYFEIMKYMPHGMVQPAVLIVDKDMKVLAKWVQIPTEVRKSLANHTQALNTITDNDCSSYEVVYSGTSEQWTRWGRVFCPLFIGCPFFGGSNVHTVVGRGHAVCPL